MTGLTKPFAATAGMEASLSVATLPSPLVSMFAPVSFPAYPVAYQVRYSDLVDLTKALRATTAQDNPGLHIGAQADARLTYARLQVTTMAL